MPLVVVLCLIVAFEKDAGRRLLAPSPPETFDTAEVVKLPDDDGFRLFRFLFLFPLSLMDGFFWINNELIVIRGRTCPVLRGDPGGSGLDWGRPVTLHSLFVRSFL